MATRYLKLSVQLQYCQHPNYQWVVMYFQVRLSAFRHVTWKLIELLVFCLFWIVEAVLVLFTGRCYCFSVPPFLRWYQRETVANSARLAHNMAWCVEFSTFAVSPFSRSMRSWVTVIYLRLCLTPELNQFLTRFLFSFSASYVWGGRLSTVR